jgi:DNA-binding beta-propeller fold protein YncE
VFTFNGKSNDSTVFDAKTGEVINASLPLGGKPEFAQVDGKGHVYANIENKNEIVEINAKDGTVTKHYSVAPCDGPSGLAIDPKKNVLFSVCDGKMVVSDPASGKVIATPTIGDGVDGVAFDDGYAFSANGKDGTITMVGENNGKYEALATIQSQIRARTIAADQKAHKLYLPTAEYGAADKGGKAPQAVPDSFEILVVGR